MRIGFYLGLMALLFTACLTRADDTQPKYSVREVMKRLTGWPAKLLNTVLDGKGTDEDKKKLLELFEIMARNKAPKGDADNWKKLNAATVAAAKDVVAGRDGAIATLKTASDCRECHKTHK